MGVFLDLKLATPLGRTPKISAVRIDFGSGRSLSAHLRSYRVGDRRLSATFYCLEALFFKSCTNGAINRLSRFYGYNEVGQSIEDDRISSGIEIDS